MGNDRSKGRSKTTTRLEEPKPKPGFGKKQAARWGKVCCPPCLAQENKPHDPSHGYPFYIHARISPLYGKRKGGKKKVVGKT